MKNIFITLLAFVLLAATSCSKWTDYEDLHYHKTPAELDPNGYQEHLARIRAYKASEHRLMMLTMSGVSHYPSHPCHHPMNLPDSTDFIFMKNLENLHPAIVAEIAKVRNDKGTKSLSYVDYAPIMEAWNAVEDAKLEAGQPAPSTDEVKAYFKAEALKQLQYCNMYGFDGILVSFVANQSTEKFKAAHDGFFEPIIQWQKDNSDKIVIARGNIVNITDRAFVSECAYHVIIGGADASRVPINSKIRRNMGREVPMDRMLLELTVPSSDVPDQVGYTPYEAATKWLLPTLKLDEEGNPIPGASPENISPCGMVVENAQDDYFDKDVTFKRIRAGITGMANR